MHGLLHKKGQQHRLHKAGQMDPGTGTGIKTCHGSSTKSEAAGLSAGQLIVPGAAFKTTGARKTAYQKKQSLACFLLVLFSAHQTMAEQSATGTVHASCPLMHAQVVRKKFSLFSLPLGKA